MKTFARKFLSVMLAAMMLLSMLPTASLAVNSSSDSFYRIVHLDCGRKYFSVQNIKDLLDMMYSVGYNQLQLAFGNDGLRFLLDDMSVTANGTTYPDDDVTAAIQAGNKAYHDEGTVNELTQEDMDTIIAYAEAKGIQIVPHLNMPGHMYAIVDALAELKFDSPAYSSESETSDSSIALDNDAVVAFCKALFKKYVDYFSAKGSTFFHIGADEYANDLSTMGFANMGSDAYAEYAGFVNDIVAIVEGAGMTARAWNDGIYYRDYSSATFDTDIQITYWSSGWWGYNVATAATLAEDFDMINTNGDYYYVLKSGEVQKPDTPENFDVTTFMGSTVSEPVGAMFCIWCDSPDQLTSDEVITDVEETLLAMGQAMGGTLVTNPDEGEGEEETPEVTGSETITDPDSQVTVTASGTSFTKISVERTKLDSDSSDGNVSVTYSITLNDGAYTDAATVKLPYNSCFDNAVLTASVYSADKGTTTIEKVDVTDDGYFVLDVPHFSDVTVNGTIEQADDDTDTSAKTYQLVSSVTSGKEYLITSGNSDSVYVMAADGSAVNATVKDGKITIDPQYAWTFTSSGNGYTVMDSNGTYMYPYAERAGSFANRYWAYFLETQTSSKTVIVSNSATQLYCSYSYDYGLTSGSTNSYVSFVDTAFTATASGTIYLFEEVEVPTYTVDNTAVNAAITAAKALNKTDYKNWNELGIDTLITNAQNAVDNETYTVESDRNTAQTAANDAAAALNTAIAQLQLYASYTITVEAYDTNDNKIYSAEQTVKENASVTIDPPSVTGYVTPTDAVAQTVTNPTSAQTVTFTGYTVAPDDLTGKSITLEYWITNRQVTANGSTTLTVQASQVYSEAGVSISTLAPSSGTWENHEMTFWKGTYLESTNKQTTDPGIDRTLSGDDYSHIRYWASTWAYYSVETNEWLPIDSADQIVVYYLQVTDVTNEVQTQVVDWGNDYDPSSYLFYDDAAPNYNYVNAAILDFQVVYPGGYTTPETTSFPVTDKTIIFHNSSGAGRTIGQIRAMQVNPIFYVKEVYLIEGHVNVSNGKCTGVTYDETTATLVWSLEEDGGDAHLDSLTFGNSNENNARLVRYVLGINPDYANLTVHYINKNNGSEFHNYGIAAISIGEDGTVTDLETFEGWVTSSGQPTGVWKVTNAMGEEEPVYYLVSDFSKIPGMPDVYANAGFTFSDASVSSDNHDLYLYYSSTNYESVVIDFGLKVKMPDYTYADKTGEYGYIDNSGYYVPTSVVDEIEVFEGTSTSGNQTITHMVSVIPASNVLYDVSNSSTKKTNDFMQVTQTTSEDDEGNVVENANWSLSGSAITTAQDSNNEAPYGYDEAYKTSTGKVGYYYTATVTETKRETDNLTVSFKGTGFDLIGTSSPTTGYIFMVVEGDGVRKVYLVDTSHSRLTLNQVPLAHVEGLTEGEYTVTIFGAYREALMSANGTAEADQVEVIMTSVSPNVVKSVAANEIAGFTAASTSNGGTIEIDSFRVYRSSSYSTAYQNATGEYGATYKRTLDALQQSSMAYVYVDDKNGQNEYTKDNYESSGGPQNEIYLPSGASIAFASDGNIPVQISFRNVDGSTSFVINGDTGNATSVAHETEMYYSVTPNNSGVVTITNNGSGLLALCNIKLNKNSKARSIIAADYPIITVLLEDDFEPDSIDFSLKTIRLLDSQTSTLKVTTSKDVDYIEVNGEIVKATNKKLVDRGLEVNYVFEVKVTSDKGDDVSFEVVAYDADGTASATYLVEE